MADEKLTQLALVTSLATSDLFYVVTDVTTIPQSHKIQFSDFQSNVSGATLAQGTLAGRGSASGSGVYEQIALGTNLSMSGATLNASGGGGGGLVLVSHQTLTSDSQNITFSGLDGNTDGVYRLVYRVKIAANTTGLLLQANGVISNQNSLRLYNGGSDNQGSGWQFDYSQNIGSYEMASIDIVARNNPNSQAFKRMYSGTGMRATNGTNIDIVFIFAGFWNDSSTNLTSLVLHADTATGLGNGSEAWLYKYEQ